MRMAKLMIGVAVAAALTASACDRGRETDETARQDTTGIEQQQEQQRQQEEMTRLEARVAELEREWNDAQARLSRQTEEATAEARAEIEQGIADLRQEIADMRTTNMENWWERHEREMEETVADVEQDVRRFARRWSPDDQEEVGTTGDAESWEARRDRLVNRIQARIESMEQALENDADARTADREDVEQTRARVRYLREQNERLREASEQDWWEITQQRVNGYIDWIETRIDRLTNDNQTSS